MLSLTATLYDEFRVDALAAQSSDRTALQHYNDHVLCAGTDQGSLYIWRLSDRQLIYLIHHTDHPVIYVSLHSGVRWSDKSSLPQAEMLLAAVDTVGALRLYAGAAAAAAENENDEEEEEKMRVRHTDCSML